MKDRHVTFELLEAVYADKAPPERLVGRAMRHLGELCPVCRSQMELFAAERFAQGAAALDFGLLLKTVERWTLRLGDERKKAHDELRELLRLESGERRGKIERSTKRFRSPILAELILAESRRNFFDDPDEAFALAELAHQVALQIHGHRHGLTLAQDLTTRAAAYQANALRCKGDLRKADSLMSRPLGRLRETADPLIMAEVLWLASSLKREQQHFGEAIHLLHQALDLYREIGNRALAGRTLVSLGEILRFAGSPERALEAVREALGLLSPEGEARDFVCARHNLALYLCETGRHREARTELEANAEIYPLFPGLWSETRQIWLRGRIAAGLQEDEAAEEAFREAKKAFGDEGRAINAALVSLDLALLHHRRGEVEKIKHLAEEMVFVFRAHEIHREATAALILFQKAAQRESVEVELVHRLARYLERTRKNPEPAFEPGPPSG